MAEQQGIVQPSDKANPLEKKEATQTSKDPSENMRLEGIQAAYGDRRSESIKAPDQQPFDWRTPYREVLSKIEDWKSLQSKQGQQVSDGNGGTIDAAKRADQFKVEIAEAVRVAQIGLAKDCKDISGNIQKTDYDLTLHNDKFKQLTIDLNIGPETIVSPQKCDEWKAAANDDPAKQQKFDELKSELIAQSKLGNELVDQVDERHAEKAVLLEYASFLSSSGSKGEAAAVYQQSRSAETIASPRGKEVAQQIHTDARPTEAKSVEKLENPFPILENADKLYSQGKKAEAEAAFKHAIAAAHKLPLEQIRQHITEDTELLKDPKVKGDKASSEKVKEDIRQSNALLNAEALSRADYAQTLLMPENRTKEYSAQLEKVKLLNKGLYDQLTDDRNQKVDARLLPTVEATNQWLGKVVEHDQHMQARDQALKAKDAAGAQRELNAAKQAAEQMKMLAEKIDRKEAAEQATKYTELLKAEQQKNIDPNDRKALAQHKSDLETLTKNTGFFEQAQQALSISKLSLASADRALGDEHASMALLDQVKGQDVSFAARNKAAIDELSKPLNPGMWEKIKAWGTDNAGSIIATTVGIGAGILCSFTPLGPVGGVAAGLAVKTLVGAALGGVAGSVVDYEMGKTVRPMDTFGKHAWEGAAGGLSAGMFSAATASASSAEGLIGSRVTSLMGKRVIIGGLTTFSGSALTNTHDWLSGEQTLSHGIRNLVADTSLGMIAGTMPVGKFLPGGDKLTGYVKGESWARVPLNVARWSGKVAFDTTAAQILPGTLGAVRGAALQVYDDGGIKSWGRIGNAAYDGAGQGILAGIAGRLILGKPSLQMELFPKVPPLHAMLAASAYFTGIRYRNSDNLPLGYAIIAQADPDVKMHQSDLIAKANAEQLTQPLAPDATTTPDGGVEPTPEQLAALQAQQEQEAQQDRQAKQVPQDPRKDEQNPLPQPQSEQK